MSWRLLYGDELTVQGVAASGGDLVACDGTLRSWRWRCHI